MLPVCWQVSGPTAKSAIPPGCVIDMTGKLYKSVNVPSSISGALRLSVVQLHNFSKTTMKGIRHFINLLMDL